MELNPMYPAKINSPGTELAEDLSVSATTVTVLNATTFPPAPNLLTLGNDETAETVLYTAIAGNTLTVERGFQGTAKSWSKGTKAARYFTAYDYDTLCEHIQAQAEELKSTKSNLESIEEKQDELEESANFTHRTTQYNGTAKPVFEGDFNEMVTTGFYTQGGNILNMANGPAKKGEWCIEVIAKESTTHIFQRIHDFGNGKTYVRQKRGGDGWTPWVAYANEADMEAIKKAVADAEKSAKAHADQKIASVKVETAKKSDFDTHVVDKVRHITAAERTAWSVAESRAKSYASSVASSAESNAKSYMRTEIAGVKQSIESMKAPPNWITPTLLSGAIPNTAWDPISYCKDALGVVRMRGTLFIGSGQTAFVLPAGYRPSIPMDFQLVSYAHGPLSRLHVETNGDISVIAGSRIDTGTTFNLSACSFLAEQ